LEEIIQFINSGSFFLVAGHKEPDGDCVGSQLAMRSALLRLGKKAEVCSAGPFKRSELRNYADQFTATPEIPDGVSCKVIIIDCSGTDRTGDIQNLLKKFPCAVIDHHAAINYTPSTPNEPVYIDSNAPSCTLLIYRLIKALGLEITEEEASCLFFGLCTDTGFFRFLTEKDSGVLDTAAELIRRGANPKKINGLIYGGRSLNSRIMTGRILSRIESYFDGKLLLSYETLEDFNAFGLEGRDSEALNQSMLATEGIEATVIIRQECADSCTVSFRSLDKIDVAKIASNFGGGGHKNASGVTIKGGITFVKEKILEAFGDIYKYPQK